MIDPKDITVYTLAHDWWEAGAFLFVMFKGWRYLTTVGSKFDNIQQSIQSDIKQAKTEMLANTTAIKDGLEKQTVSIVNELRELRQDFRMALIPPRPARASRAKKIVDTSMDV